MNVISMITCCPDDVDERTERYCMHWLSAGETKRFETHLAMCPACLDEMLETGLFLEALVLALGENKASSYPYY